MNDQSEPSTIDAVSPEEVGAAAVAFMDGLVVAFGTTGTSSLTVDDTELEVRLDGEGLGLLVGPGGRTLNAVQDLVRVAAQRRLGDHETRLRIDVAGYRVRRQEALTRFGREVAEAVRSSGTARILEPMTSADRKPTGHHEGCALFSPEEVTYLSDLRLARLATVDAEGQSYNGTSSA
jgi:spoIIIJ-associated protein